MSIEGSKVRTLDMAIYAIPAQNTLLDQSTIFSLQFPCILHTALGSTLLKNTYDLVFCNEAAADLAAKQILGLRQY